MTASARPSVSNRYRILLVDDNPSIHDDFRKILCRSDSCAGAAAENVAALEELLFDEVSPGEGDVRADFVVDSAYQGEQAIQLVEAAIAAGEPYALAFIDVRMPPGIDGVETLTRLWKRDPNLQGVICTAFSDHSWTDMTRALGHSDGFLVLRKPFDTIEVLQIAHALVQKWQLSRDVREQLDTLELRVRERTRDLEITNSTLRDEIAKRQQAEADLRQIATHDALTGLPNRILMKDRLTRALRRAQGDGTMVGLCLLDLDQFKDVNDNYGHPVGDALLQQIAQRLRASVREQDTVARMGGDEFVIVFEGVTSHEQVSAIVGRLVETCSKPCVIGEQSLKTPPSVGIAMYPFDSVDADRLLKCADLAMYQAKRSGGGDYKYYAEGMLERSLEQIELRQHLERAIDRGELSLWYQPLVDLATGHVSGLEALLRWQHPELGLISPMKFIPIAEKSGLIVPIGTWVVQTACRQLAEWRRHLGDLTMAVNVSAVQLRSPDFVNVVAAVLDETGLPPSCLELEITESTATDDEHNPGNVLADLASLGVRIVIDDFGSGYSSMMRLKTMPIRGLKIDRTFVKDIAEDNRDATIVAAILSMAHSLGLTVVAEGIERPEQLERLRNLERYQDRRVSCDTVQGFLLGRPMPVEATGILLGQQQHAASLPPLRKAG